MRICAGIDVVKDIHWATAIDQDARVLIDRARARAPGRSRAGGRNGPDHPRARRGDRGDALVRELAREALAVRERLTALDRELEASVARHPDGALIRSLPGMGVIMTAEFLAAAGDIARFRSPDALAAAAGLAPVLRQSGKARAFRRANGGDKALKRVFYQSAFCAVSIKDPPSKKAFYDRKRREGHRHVQAPRRPRAPPRHRRLGHAQTSQAL